VTVFGRRLDELFLPVVLSIGTLVVVRSVWQLAHGPVDERWFVLASLTLLSGSATLKLPGTPVSFSISDSFTMAAALMFGPAAGTVTVAIDGLVISLGLARRSIPPRRVFYNATAPPLAIWIAAQVFFLFVDADWMASARMSAEYWILPLAVFAGLFFLLNTGLVAVAIACEQRVDPVQIWREHFVGLWLTYFGGAAVAALLIVLVQGRHPNLLVLLLLAPIPLIIYATFRHAIGRMEDRVSHLNQMNGMYLSTIETLAQAIDAKDQVTHGHVRRVQQYAIKLAQALGVRDQLELRALDAASLLHDVGKLAVPEHILNKPSTLTPVEFDKMKRHANVGADILSSIGFPYPVVPIVRHHHENWDGSGYPVGLASDAIPIGARILAVVDCFDALVSDRPYRPRLSQPEALRVLQARSGTMYDPRVVAKFLEIVETVPTEPHRTAPSEGLADITHAARRETIRAGASEADAETLAVLFELGGRTATASSPGAAMTHIQTILQRLMPADICALYVYSAETDSLTATCVAGTHSDAILRTTIPLGQRLTGWVAANRQTILNSDAALDLGNLTLTLDPTPHGCLAAPIFIADDLVGVLSIYSTRRQPFTETHLAIVETIADGVGCLLKLEGARASGPCPTTSPSATPTARALPQVARTSIH
jgi:putative nucleotidyltransferase with HDIG domain